MYGSTAEEDAGLFSAGFPFMTVPYNQLIIFTSQKRHQTKYGRPCCLSYNDFTTWALMLFMLSTAGMQASSISHPLADYYLLHLKHRVALR